MAKSKKDIYANRAFAEVTLSAANTITFQKLNFAVGVFQGIALKILRAEFYPGVSSYQELVAATDNLGFGLTLRDDLLNLDPTNLAVICSNTLGPIGTVVDSVLYDKPITRDFSTFPEGGLLIPANPVFLAAITAGAAAASVVQLVLYYVFVQLSDRESIELLQTIIPGNV